MVFDPIGAVLVPITRLSNLKTVLIIQLLEECFNYTSRY